MKRSTRMNIMRGSLLVALTLFALACGRDRTMASKSAAAYREARAKGIPVSGGHEHGGHQATFTSGTGEAMDHSAHATAADPHAGHDMTAAGGMDHDTHGAMSATDHAAMEHGATSNAHTGHTTGSPGAMDHSAHGAMAGAAADPHAGMQHGTSMSPDQHGQHGQPSSAMAHAGHGTMQQSGAGAPRVVLTAPATNTEIARTQPGATLQPDDFDAPAPSAVAEAQKAAGAGGHEGHGTPSNTTADPHAGHGSASGASQQTVYTCPMHPEVTSATPGTCPKCGMTLVKKKEK